MAIHHSRDATSFKGRCCAISSHHVSIHGHGQATTLETGKYIERDGVGAATRALISHTNSLELVTANCRRNVFEVVHSKVLMTARELEYRNHVMPWQGEQSRGFLASCKSNWSPPSIVIPRLRGSI